VALAGHFLLQTLTSGREGRHHSHRWYWGKGVRSRDWKDPTGDKLVELRSTGRQTLVEPSTHPDGDRYLWHRESGAEIAEASPEELTESLNTLATAALVARHVPPVGGRHDFALALSGFLLRPGRMDQGLVLKILGAAWHAAGAASREAERDLEGIVRDTAGRLRAGEPVVGGTTLEEYVPGIVRVLCKWWGWEDRKSAEELPAEEAEEKEEKFTQAQLLVRCTEGADLFHTPAGETYATVPVGEHRETHPIKSKGFRRWLVRGYYEAQGRPPGSQAMQDALGLLEARAQFDGEEREVHVRTAEHGGALYLDHSSPASAREASRAAGGTVPGEPRRTRRASRRA